MTKDACGVRAILPRPEVRGLSRLPINGTKTLIRYAKYGSGLTALQGMCDAELCERYADTKH